MRAMAILIVVLFHLQFSAFQGGYVGVDVFFVISGFLITAIIRRRAEVNAFSFKSFYLRRIRRLVPALIATVAATLTLSAFVLAPSEMIATGRSAVAAMFSVSNVLFYSEAGYWDAAAELKPLLHTWSLGVEEQFYLIWPALIVAMVRFRRSLPFGVSIGLMAAASFVLAIRWAGIDLSAAFYLIPFRVYQFSLGAFVGWVIASGRLPERVPVWVREGLFLTGMGLILASVFAYTDATTFPGWHAAPPTIGAALLLAAGGLAGGQGPLGRAVLANPLSRWLGRVSYALYLVHWPIVVLYRYEFGLDLNLTEQALLATVMLIATVALHYGVERRFYTRSSGEVGIGGVTAGTFALRTLAASLIVTAIASTAWLGNGWSWRFESLSLTAEEIEAGKGARYDLWRKGCALAHLDDTDRCHLDRPIQVLLLGNSHEPDGYNFMLGGYGHRDDINYVKFGTTNGCAGIFEDGGNWASSNEECNRRIGMLFNPAFINTIDVVVYSANQPFSGNKGTFVSLLTSMKGANKNLRVITYGGYINTSVECARLLNETGATDACALPENVVYFESDPTAGALFAEIAGLTDHYIDRVGLLCDGRRLDRCETRTPEGVPMFYDKHHSSFEFAVYSGERYAQAHPDLIDAVIEATSTR